MCLRDVPAAVRRHSQHLNFLFTPQTFWDSLAKRNSGSSCQYDAVTPLLCFCSFFPHSGSSVSLASGPSIRRKERQQQEGRRSQSKFRRRLKCERRRKLRVTDCFCCRSRLRAPAPPSRTKTPEVNSAAPLTRS